MFYFIKTPRWFKLLCKDCIWQVETSEKVLYLTFDDGPHNEITLFVLNELKKFQAKATFFCIGKNIAANPALYQQLLNEGHSTGNHTYNHLNGWKTKDSVYLDDIEKAKSLIHSPLFRPPYGRITAFQRRQLKAPRFQLTPVMWTVLSGDFDTSISGDECLANVILNSFPGSIIVFHDSVKAFEKLKVALPGTLKYFSERGYRFESLETGLKQVGPG